MNVTLLIDAVVRQTTVLIAELATSGGLRAPLAHLADQVFIDLAGELERQGLSRKVGADMFGMALRSYQRKVQRLEESGTDRGRSLWDAVYDYVRSTPVVTRRDVLERFARDDEELVRGVLADLVESALVFATGPTQSTSFRAATDAELGAMARDRKRVDPELLWALVCRMGPISVSTLANLGGMNPEAIERALSGLVAGGRIKREDSGEHEASYRTASLVISIGAKSGWEAAVFDHFHAVIRTICTKLRRGSETSLDDQMGGSTYSYEVWPGHPLRDEVLGTLRRFREVHSALREKVRDYNQSHEGLPKRVGVVVYAGQTLWEIDSEHEERQ